jgi:hypothetical protein
VKSEKLTVTGIEKLLTFKFELFTALKTTGGF